MTKKNYSKNINISDDIRKAFSILVKKPVLYHITISKTKSKHTADLRYTLTNKLFNALNKQYRHLNYSLDYLFVIEYAGAISKEEEEINGLGEHAHIIVHTSIPSVYIKKQIDIAFNYRHNSLIDNISNRSDKENLVNYILKQEKLLSKENYNYKIN